MKKIIVFILILFFVNNVYAQDKQILLNTKFGKLSKEKIELAISHGIISKSESPFLAIRILELIEEGADVENMTFGELIASYYQNKKEHENYTAQMNNFGKDSVFFRTPDGDKMLIGMGKMSLEKLVLREANKKFPKNYKEENYNILAFPDNISLYANILSTHAQNNITEGVLAGNAMWILNEAGNDMTLYRIGDFIVIGKRVKNAKEFKPFLSFFQEMQK